MPSERELIQQIQTHVTRLVQAVADAEFWHRHWLEQAEQEHQQRIAAAETEYQQVMAQIRSAYEQQVHQAIQEHERRISEVEATYQAAMAKAKNEYGAKVTKQAFEKAEGVIRDAGLLAAPWDDPLWNAWTPAGGGHMPPCLRIGQLAESGSWDTLTLPALLPLASGRNVLFKATGPARTAAVQAIQSLLLRLLATMAPGMLRFTFVDPVGLGQNVAAFMHLRDHDEELVTFRAWTESRHIEERLAALTEHMETVIQTFLRNQYPTIEAYNAKAGETAEAYRVLVVFDFPTNFSEDAARRLVSIAQNGPRCGVYTIVLVDTEKPLPHGFNLADLERTATVIAWDGKRFVWQDGDFGACQLELDAPPALILEDQQKQATLFGRIITTVGEKAREAKAVQVPFERVVPPPDRWWEEQSLDGLQVPLGPAGANRLQELTLGRGTAQHALVAGRTGAGKSTLLHVLIANLALAYSPEEVELYLVDFKKGVEFKTYATHAPPHARVVAIESEREFGLSVLQGLDAELTRRGELFRAAGVDHIADYRKLSGGAEEPGSGGAEGQRSQGEYTSAPRHPSTSAPPLPRILLIVDEFQEFFTEDDAVAAQASQILDRLVRQGRAFGIHVLLGSQTLAGAYTLARSTIDQMAVRIALQCSEADSRLILADDDPAARLLSRPGAAIYNDANGLVEGNHPFQVAWLSDDERDRYLERVQALARKHKYRPPQPQIVFEGNAPADVTKNRPLNDLLVTPLSRRTGEGPRVRATLAWLGDPIAIKDPTAARFRRQSGSNLLIVGQHEELTLDMLSTALISLAAQSPISNLQLPISQFYILDFTPVDAPYAHLFPHGRTPAPPGATRPAPRTPGYHRRDRRRGGPPAGRRRDARLPRRDRGRGPHLSLRLRPAARATCGRKRISASPSAWTRRRHRPTRPNSSPPSCAKAPTWGCTPWCGATPTPT